MNSFVQEVGLYLQQDDGEAILPVLDEIELLTLYLIGLDEEYQRRAAEALAAFESFISARERAGRLVKVYHCEQTQNNHGCTSSNSNVRMSNWFPTSLL